MVFSSRAIVASFIVAATVQQTAFSLPQDHNHIARALPVSSYADSKNVFARSPPANRGGVTHPPNTTPQQFEMICINSCRVYGDIHHEHGSFEQEASTNPRFVLFKKCVEYLMHFGGPFPNYTYGSLPGSRDLILYHGEPILQLGTNTAGTHGGTNAGTNQGTDGRSRQT